MERTFRDFRVGPILLQKSPQRFCEIRIGNNRIDVGEYLNQCCGSASQLESILRGRMGKIFLQQYRPEPAEHGWAEDVRSARGDQTSTCSANARASSTSIPRYRTVLS